MEPSLPGIANSTFYKYSLRTLLFSFYFWSLLTTLSAQWQWQNPLPQGNGYNDIFFVSQSHGWLVGEFGTIVCTNDGGDTWEIQETGIEDDLDVVSFRDLQD